MKIIIAPDSFKGTMSAKTVAGIIKEAFISEDENITVKTMPMSDGGEGLIDIYENFADYRKITKFVSGPNGDMVKSSYLLKDDTAIIEMAQASGIMLTPEKKDPMHADTFGTGELIADACKNGAENILLGVGGSATMDGGAGMIKALGFILKNKNGEEIPACPQGLSDIYDVDDSFVTEKIKNLKFTVASDVKNTVCGKDGAAYVFGRQKGANTHEIQICDENLKKFTQVLESKCGKDLMNLECGGAAGGIILPLAAFFDVKIISGADMMLDVFNFDKEVKDADAVITGEGRIDSQSLSGKVPVAVAKRAKKAGVHTIVIAGDACDMTDEIKETGISAIFAINRRAIPFKEAKLFSKKDLFETAKAIAAIMKLK